MEEKEDALLRSGMKTQDGHSAVPIAIVTLCVCVQRMRKGRAGRVSAVRKDMETNQSLPESR